MDGVTILRQELEDVARGLLRELEGLTAEHVAYRPAPEANTIAFLSWHITRTLDNAAHAVVPRQPQPTLWERDGWQERFGLGTEERGTGFTADQVARFKPTPELLRDYGRRVADAIAPAFETLTDADLDRVPDPEQPRMTLGRRLMIFIVGHTYYHLGEVRFLKGLQGMPFPL